MRVHQRSKHVESEVTVIFNLVVIEFDVLFSLDFNNFLAND